VGVAGGLIDGTYMRFADELGKVLDDGDNLRILPMVLEKWLSLNAEYAKVWPNITVKDDCDLPHRTLYRGADRRFPFSSRRRVPSPLPISINSGGV